MQIVVRIPDEMLDGLAEKLPPPEMGALETVALEALLTFLDRLRMERVEMDMDDAKNDPPVIVGAA